MSFIGEGKSYTEPYLMFHVVHFYKFHMKLIAKHLETGKIGEEIAKKYLINKGFLFKEANYWRPWGEIDLIMKKGDTTHFVEVKTVLRVFDGSAFVETDFKPIDNVHEEKVARLRRVIETYVAQHRLEDKKWQIDVVGIMYDAEKKKAKVEYFSDLVL